MNKDMPCGRTTHELSKPVAAETRLCCIIGSPKRGPPALLGGTRGATTPGAYSPWAVKLQAPLEVPLLSTSGGAGKGACSFNSWCCMRLGK